MRVGFSRLLGDRVAGLEETIESGGERERRRSKCRAGDFSLDARHVRFYRDKRVIVLLPCAMCVVILDGR